MLALFIALGGIAFAAALPRNSVGTNQLKKNAVRTSDIRNNAVTRSKIKNNAINGAKVQDGSLTGAELALGTLGKVPAAATADNADKLDGKDSGDFLASSDYRRVLVKLQLGEEQEVVRNGPVSVYARCADSGGNVQLQMFARTDTDGTLMHTSWGDVLNGGPASGDFLNTSTPEGDREWDNTNTSPASDFHAIAPAGEAKLVTRYDDSRLIAPSGEAISWEGEAETLALNFLGARCLISGDVHIYKLG
jgi:hypothetical protein